MGRNRPRRLSLSCLPSRPWPCLNQEQQWLAVFSHSDSHYTLLGNNAPLTDEALFAELGLVIAATKFVSLLTTPNMRRNMMPDMAAGYPRYQSILRINPCQMFKIEVMFVA